MQVDKSSTSIVVCMNEQRFKGALLFYFWLICQNTGQADNVTYTIPAGLAQNHVRFKILLIIYSRRKNAADHVDMQT